ncbi:hypothetical protein BEK98_27750 [Streptomyces diastatochromogenes]|uniref:Uncharacterized protein n=1 Tax=Streptomyces diastatochromogenes TaxID=42236 RepID=A0A233S8L5_STRDA|nr:hypothetical protein BEK98_27750 [Streptomyces diastatochromogenes]
MTWSHAAEPVTGPGGVTGLWHTRLTGAPQLRLQPAGPARPTQPVDGPLTLVERQQIKDAMGRKPLSAKSMALSALGASVDLTGDWAGTPGATVPFYHHRSVTGRDSSVHVVLRGFLLPFCLPVQVTSHTERRLDSGLVKVSQLIVMGPVMDYLGVTGCPNGGRSFPFARVRLCGPTEMQVSTTAEPLQFGCWLRAAPGSPRIKFTFAAEDVRQRPVSFTSELAFVPGGLTAPQLRMTLDAYDQQARDVIVPASGRLELVIPPASTDTSVDVTGLSFGAEPAAGDPAVLEAAGRLPAWPRLTGLTARLPALDALASRSAAAPTGSPAGATDPARLTLDANYLANGLNTASKVYAAVQPPVGVAPPVTSSGGIAALAQKVSGLSDATGLVSGDLAKFKSGTFDPDSYFPPPESGLPTKLLGFLDLRKVVQGVQPMSTSDGDTVPRIVTVPVPQGVQSGLVWRPKVPRNTDLCNGLLHTGGGAALELHNTILAPLDGSQPQVDSRGELRDFTLNFLNRLLTVRFERLAFSSRPGAGPSLDAKVAEVHFGGDLHFLERLRDYLPSPASGPKVNVAADGIEVGYVLAVPSIGAGVFLLQNLMVATTVTLPFNGDAVKARFTVSSRDHPFLVTVSLFGGGGFFALAVQSDRPERFELEAQLEFGAAASLNLGVASGSVCVTAGIYIKMKGSQAHLEGFLRAVGELEVLGIISISVEFYLGLSYDTNTKVVHGHAEIIVRVRVAFFTKSVSLQVDRDFGGGSDPTFADAFPTPEPWQRRCAAFAPMEGT